MAKELIVFLEDLRKDYIKDYIIENLDNENINLFLRELENKLEVFYRSKETIFYCQEDISAFCKDFSNDETYLLSLKEQLYEILKDARPYNNLIIPSHHTRYYRWDYCSEKVERLQDDVLAGIDVLAEITERQSRNGLNKHFVLLVPTSNHPYICRKYITTFKDDNANLPRFEQIDYVVDVSSAEKWVQKNRTDRKMNKNPKHGENGQGAHKGNKGDKVSRLLCSISEAQDLLDTAYQDKRVDEKRVFSYDIKNHAFIVFFCEGYFEGEIPYYQYHGFHLEDEREINKIIPNSIFKILAQKFNL